MCYERITMQFHYNLHKPDYCLTFVLNILVRGHSPLVVNHGFTCGKGRIKNVNDNIVHLCVDLFVPQLE